MALTDAQRKAMFASRQKHIQVIKKELDNNLIKMKNSPDNLNIIKERENLQKQLKQVRKKHG